MKTSFLFVLVAAILGSVLLYLFLSNNLTPVDRQEKSSQNSTDTSSTNNEKQEAVVESETSSTLDLHSQGLTTVPASIFTRFETEVLDLRDNNLTGSLPAEIRYLKNLRSLNLSGNNFTGVPAEIGQLTMLETLDLSNNPITGLPHELGNLNNLKVLNLSGTTYSKQDFAIIKETLPKNIQVIE